MVQMMLRSSRMCYVYYPFLRVANIVALLTSVDCFTAEL